GIGIAPEHLPRLTERFYRIDRSRSRATGGTGLGLAMVKHVLLRHQATLEIASEPGQGSTFAVRLPARRVQRAPLAPDAPAPVTSNEAPNGTTSSVRRARRPRARCGSRGTAVRRHPPARPADLPRIPVPTGRWA